MKLNPFEGLHPIENPKYLWVTNERHELIGLMKGPIPEDTGDFVNFQGQMPMEVYYQEPHATMYFLITMRKGIWAQGWRRWWVLVTSEPIEQLKKLEKFR